MTPPTQDELNQLAQDEAFLRAEMQKLADKRAALVRQQEEERRLAAAARNITITALRFVQGVVIVSNSDYRADVVAAQQKIVSRNYIGNGENSFVAHDWPSVKAAMAKLPNVKIVISVALEREIYEYINAPTWDISLGIRSFECKPGPKAYIPMYAEIPGAEYKAERKLVLIPLTEGWRLWHKMESVIAQAGTKVEWSKGAQALILKQLEARARLDQIATMERGEKYKDYTIGEFTLRHFQEVGAEFIDAAGGRALLADGTGLGKTIQFLAYATMNNLRSVVVCPASLKANWARKIRQATGVSPFVMSGGEPTRYDMVRLLTDPPQITLINFDILGRKSKSATETTDAQGFKHVAKETRFLWVDLLNLSKPDIYCVDEAHYAKNMDSNRSEAVRMLKAPRVLCMTATPVLNRPGEYWPLLNLIAPDLFPSHDTFIRQYTIDGKRAKNVAELKQVLRTIMIRRTRKDVSKDMPPVNRIDEYHELSPKALKLYRKIEGGIYETMAEFSASGKSGERLDVINVLAMIQRLKMVCAIDKASISADQARDLYDQADEDDYRKVVIFSQYKGVAYKISQLLGGECLSFVSRGRHDFVTANDQERDRLVQQFQTDPNVHFLVVTEKTAKEGHDMTAAGYIIFNDLFWTPAAHEQGEGRAYAREGDMHGIDALYNISTLPQSALGDEVESIEEWIYELLEMKKGVIAETVDGVEASRDVSIGAALIERLKSNMGTRRR